MLLSLSRRLVHYQTATTGGTWVWIVRIVQTSTLASSFREINTAPFWQKALTPEADVAIPFPLTSLAGSNSMISP